MTTRFRSSRTILRSGAALVAAATVFVACNDEPTAPVQVAAADVVAPVTAIIATAISGKTFAFRSGAALSPALANQPVSITMTTTGSSTTAVIVTPGGTLNTSVVFGSCAFTVLAPGTPQFPTGIVMSVQYCNITVRTRGTVVGKTVVLPILLTLATPQFSTQSDAQTVSASVSSTGVVTATTQTGAPVVVGTTTTTTSTGSTGSGS